MNTRARLTASSAQTAAGRDANRSRSLSLDDLDEQSVPLTGRGDEDDDNGNGRDTLGELESPAIESLQDRLLVTPIRWQTRSTASPEPGQSSASSSSSPLYRRDSAPAAAGVGASLLLLRHEEIASRRCSNPALLETIEEGRVGCRRKSLPAVMVHGQAHRQRVGGVAAAGALHLSPRRTLLANAVAGSSEPGAGAEAESVAGALPARRRRSMPEISSQQRGSVTLETFHPPPRRNSLMSCSLSEVAARFELLNTSSSVPEEGEQLDRSRTGYDRNNGTAAHNRSPITL